MVSFVPGLLQEPLLLGTVGWTEDQEEEEHHDGQQGHCPVIAAEKMITAAAYKFAIATMLPPVAYLTLIDKFVMALSLVLLLCAVQNAVFGIKEGRGDGDSPLIFSQEADLASSAVLLGVWVLLHLLYWRKIVLAMRRRRSRFSGAAAALRMTGAGESESAASRA